MSEEEGKGVTTTSKKVGRPRNVSLPLPMNTTPPPANKSQIREEVLSQLRNFNSDWQPTRLTHHLKAASLLLGYALSVDDEKVIESEPKGSDGDVTTVQGEDLERIKEEFKEFTL
jgi:aconitase A